MDLAPGVLLVAEPAMLDPNFKRAVILVCDHNDEGTFGLVLNRPTDLHLPEVLVEPVGLDHPVFIGGPVQPDTLHFLHGYADEIAEAVPVAAGIGWGGPFEEVAERIRLGAFDPDLFRFFAGYAGWGTGQLAGEIEDGSWVILPANPATVFGTPPDRLWRELVAGLGGDMALLVNYPDDPRSN
jgi:putative transcriptional regulator